ncbi:MAG: TonB family protein, partial [Pseudomonadota bacterium]
FSIRDASTQPSEPGTTDVTDTGGAFEDFAEPVPEAEQPEVTPADPVADVTPTSEALVASDNPQDTLAPDAAVAEEPLSEAEEQLEGDPEVDQVEEQGGEDDENIGEVAALQPDEVTTEGSTPETVPEEPEPEASTEDTPDVVEPEVPELASEEEADSPSEVDISEPEPADIVVASVPEDPEILTTDDTDDLSQSAVTRSLRPPAKRPSTEELGATDYVQQRQARVIESPLDVYRRTGIDQLALGRSGGSGSTSFAGSGGAGNATTTNYVGRVLVQLNRFPTGRTSDSGTASVQFQINPNGSLAWVRIVRSSGSAAVDRAAATQVRRAAPFPPT